MSAGKFIVVFKPEVTQDQITEYVDQVNNSGGEVTHRYDSVLNGFAATLTPLSLQSFQSLVGTGGVIDYIEPDGIVTIHLSQEFCTTIVELALVTPLPQNFQRCFAPLENVVA
ncbi:hypothetical protein K443DRAFT_239265 [Laccaria amethystina LaAM-08-1]|uniref:Inhibitor I9 domain-containing protein n=1 Tax=Laccaria amethystina LaAM-08-1 TaxID=1095629 RepID=A0A0C9X8E2_9AGAR|nr:hypothetical protein K443DRAFT_239265 [Laccaria amethystina LaAM-08-1]